VALIAQVKEELAPIGLDALLGLGEILDLEAEMMGAHEGRTLLDVGCLAAGSAGEIEQREIDHPIAHVDRGADLQILAADALEVEDVGVEFRRLVEVFHTDCKMAQTGHGYPPRGRRLPLPNIIAPLHRQELPFMPHCR